MATTTVDLPTEWVRTKINYKGVASVTIDKNTRGSQYTETRPDRKKQRRKTSGWLYPKPYDLHVATSRFDPHCIARSHGLVNAYVNGKNQLVPYYQINQGNPGILLGTGGAGPAMLPSDANLRKTAEIKALLKLKEDRINLGNAFAEHRQTAKFVGDTFTAIARSIRYAKKAKWKKSFHELKRRYKKGVSVDKPRIPNKWLEWKYAVEPLMSDVSGACFALSGNDQVSQWITTVKGVVKQKNRIVINRNVGTLHETTNVHDQLLGYFVRMDFHPGSDFLNVLNNYGAVNPLVPLWEITPWSFVIDWAIPIGEWFEAMDATLGFEFLSGSLTERVETKVTIRENPGPLANSSPITGPWRYGNVHVRGKQRTLRLKRTVYTKPPVPLLPRYKNPLSTGHVANGLSLLVGLMSGGKVPDYVRR